MLILRTSPAPSVKCFCQSANCAGDETENPLEPLVVSDSAAAGAGLVCCADKPLAASDSMIEDISLIKHPHPPVFIGLSGFNTNRRLRLSSSDPWEELF